MADENEKQNEKDGSSSKESINNKKLATKGIYPVWSVVIMIAVILLIAGSSFAAGRFSGRRGKFMATANNSPETCPGLDVPGKVGVARRGGDENGRLAKPGQEITGTITKISGNDLTISSQDKTYTIVIDEDTSISKSGDIAKQSDLKEKDQISITGSSKSDGSITAQTIIIK